MKKKAVKQGTPSAKTLRGRRSAPSKKPFRLEVGKFYRSRGGHFTALITHKAGGEWCFKGLADYDCGPKNIPRSWKPNGDFWIRIDDGDLIREVQPKSPKGRGK